MSKPNMTFEQAKIFLATCERNRLVDKFYGDEEIDWCQDDIVVAGGYKSSHSSSVSIDETLEFAQTSFVGDQADILCGIGLLGKCTRNDVGDDSDD